MSHILKRRLEAKVAASMTNQSSTNTQRILHLHFRWLSLPHIKSKLSNLSKLWLQQEKVENSIGSIMKICRDNQLTWILHHHRW